MGADHNILKPEFQFEAQNGGQGQSAFADCLPEALHLALAESGFTRAEHRLTPKEHRLAPAEHTLTPTRHTLTPTRHTLAPTRHALAPTRHTLTPTRHALTPMGHTLASAEHTLASAGHGFTPTEHRIWSEHISTPAGRNVIPKQRRILADRNRAIAECGTTSACHNLRPEHSHLPDLNLTIAKGSATSDAPFTELPVLRQHGGHYAWPMELIRCCTQAPRSSTPQRSYIQAAAMAQRLAATEGGPNESSDEFREQ